MAPLPETHRRHDTSDVPTFFDRRPGRPDNGEIEANTIVSQGGTFTGLMGNICKFMFCFWFVLGHLHHKLKTRSFNCLRYQRLVTLTFRRWVQIPLLTLILSPRSQILPTKNMTKVFWDLSICQESFCGRGSRGAYVYTYAKFQACNISRSKDTRAVSKLNEGCLSLTH